MSRASRFYLTSQSSCLAACLLGALAMPESAQAADGPPAVPPASLLVPSAIDIEPVWSGHGVGFCLLTRHQRQFAAYYDAKRQLTVAQRELGSATWTFTKLPTSVGWDSHNYVSMAFDDAGFLHLSGNMHCVPLIYFRATRPDDATSLERISNMVVPALEKRVTYPKFIRGPAGQLVFRYRDGGSGNGNDIYNVYDRKSRTWRHLLATPLTDGRGKMNAYFSAPTIGPDGWFHMWGVWRDTPDCATNHHLSYARSRDLRHWETGSGKALTIPLTVDNIDVVDPVPPGGGLLNGCSALGFDARNRPVISYHKYDQSGGSQVYCARLEDGVWHHYQTTDWHNYRFNFKGGGSLPGFEVGMGAATVTAGGLLTMSVHQPNENKTWILDPATLKPTAPAPPKRAAQAPPTWHTLECAFPGMTKHHCESQGESPNPRLHYALSWETLPANRDRPREGKLPEPSMLKLCTLIDPPDR
ncbi:MAG: BNR repeat-containing protein [Verrucomicrobiota bacterium]